jgi:arginase family enzyme
MEERLADRLVQLGLRAVSDEHRAQFRRFGVEAIEARHLGAGVRLALETPVYLSVDLDALDPAYAPGVSHREPGGLTTRQVIDLIHAIDRPLVGADVVEYNPRCDLSNQTALVAAKLVKEIIGVMLAAPR